MTPPSLARVIATAGAIALRTRELGTSGSHHEDPNLLIWMQNFNVGHLPRPAQMSTETFRSDHTGIKTG